MARTSIIEGEIDNSFWPKVILAMIYIKNIRLTKALQGLSPYQELFKTLLNLAHLQVLGSTVYVLIHKVEQELKSEKFVPRVLKGKLVGFDSYTIYRVHIKEQNQVIRVKDLCIFKDTETKENILLPSYKDKPTFQGFFLEDNDDKDLEVLLPISTPATSPTISGISCIVKPTPKAKDANVKIVASSSSSHTGPKVKSTKNKLLLYRGQKIEDSKDAIPSLIATDIEAAIALSSCVGQTVKNIENARQISKKTLPKLNQTIETQELII